MVLSLPFILAFIGSAVALIIGMVIYGDISEAIECPAGGTGGGGGGGDLFNTLGTLPDGDGVDMEVHRISGQLITLSNEQIQSVTVNNIDSGSNSNGILNAVIYSGVSNNTAFGSTTLEATSDSIDLSDGAYAFNSDFDITFNFTTAPTLSGSDIVIALEVVGEDDQLFLEAVDTDIGGNEGIAITKENTEFWVLNPIIENHPNLAEDILMQVTLAGGEPAETGSEQCQQAKDISWTVIGIIPVALFFSLFAIFSALGTGRQG